MLAVAGGKGGCGKTTTTLGLALAAARRGQSVLAVDADVDVPDLHRVAGIEAPDGSRPGHIVPQRVDEPPGPSPRRVPGAARVFVLPARPGTDPGRLRDRLRGIAGEYDEVLLDCPAGGGRDAAVPIRVADGAVLVTTAGEASLRDAAKTGAMARAVGTPVVGAVMARTGRIPDGVAALLGTSTVVAVPARDSSIRDGEVQCRYREISRRLTDV